MKLRKNCDELFDSYKNNAYQFIEDVLGVRLNHQQREMLILLEKTAVELNVDVSVNKVETVSCYMLWRLICFDGSFTAYISTKNEIAKYKKYLMQIIGSIGSAEHSYFIKKIKFENVGLSQNIEFVFNADFGWLQKNIVFITEDKAQWEILKRAIFEENTTVFFDLNRSFKEHEFEVIKSYLTNKKNKYFMLV